jgi:hypothetical protein
MYSICIQCVESHWRPYSAGLLYSVSQLVNRLRAYKIACPSQHKNPGGEGASNRETAATKSFCRLLLKAKSFCIAFYEPYPFYVSWTHLSCRYGEPSHEEQEGQRKGDLS